eukprot:305169_1
MANIRDLGDTSHESVEPIPNPNAQLQQAMIQQQQPQPDGQRQQEGGINKSELQQPFMMGAGGEGAEGGIYKHPPITKVFAPNFTPKSFIFIISIIQIVVFIGELIVGQIWFCGAFVSGNGMAGPSSTCFKWIGAKFTVHSEWSSVAILHFFSVTLWNITYIDQFSATNHDWLYL